MKQTHKELSKLTQAEFDSEVRFRALAARGDTAKALALLDKLDEHFATNLSGL